MQVQIQVPVPVSVKVSPKAIKSLTEGYLMSKVLELRGKKASFTLPELIGSDWPEECEMFYGLYNNSRTAGQSMGKLLGEVGRKMGLRSAREDRRGKVGAITRYFF